MLRKLICIISMLHGFFGYSQGIKGQIVDEAGIEMPYASIYVSEISKGTATNLEGNYELKLNPGTYNIVYQFIGYGTIAKKVTIENQFVVIDVQLQPQSLTLTTVTVTDKAEDPAYTIMRKAIAKAEFHLLQYNSYSAMVYMKGTGKVDKIPGFLRKQLEKEGLDTGRAFTSESVSEITYERPNSYKEKVISIRTSGSNEANANPNSYINSSFYQPKVVDGISPLSPRAFGYYRFKFLGSFMDQGYEVNKISVIPRAKGENVFTGIIYIRERYYNIHSLDLNTTIQGFDLNIKQNYAPIHSEIWMPVTQKYAFSGSLLGFSFKYNYLASISNYEIEINDELDASVYLLDEKIEDVPEDIVEIDKKDLDKGLKEVFDEDKKITRKEFNKLINEYEKEELRRKKEERKNGPEIVREVNYTVDSMATKKDSSYWEDIRPIPLTNKEIESYRLDDSIYVAEEEKRKNDSIYEKDGKSFGVGDIFFGNRYKLGENLRFNFDGFIPQFRFNTVEGWNLDFAGQFYWNNDTNLRLKISPNIRYGFDSEQWYGKLNTSFGFGKNLKRNNFQIEGGKYIYEFNPGAIDPTINSLYTLLLVRNYMRLYDKDYIKLNYSRSINYKIKFYGTLEWASRNELFNNSGWSLVDRENYRYQLNEPENIETTVGGFMNSQTLRTSISVEIKPWMRFYKYNGKTYPVRNNSPEFRLTYNSGWQQTDYHQLELGVKTAFEMGIKAIFDLDLEAGTFLQSDQLEFMDFKHFNGGLTEFAPLNSTGNFRILDYYNFSTSGNYISILTHTRFRKLFFTQIPAIRLIGVKENLFVNYLKTDYSPHYYELGFGIENIFKILRIEFVQSFYNDEIGDFGIRIGVSTGLSN